MALRAAKSLLIAAALALQIAPGHAAPLTATDIMSQFNAVIAGNFTSTSDVEGRLVANHIAGGATFYNQPRGAASAFGAVNAITVGSGLTNGNVNNGGNVTIQGTNQGRFNLNGGGTVTTTPAFAMADFTAPLNAFSAQLAGLTANSTVDATDPNSFTFKLTPDAHGTAVFSLTTAELALARNLVFSGTANTIIIDVVGSAFNSTTNFNAGDFINRHLIWNFTDATSLGFQGWHGAVLAPMATVTNSSAMEGFLYAANFNGRGELHDFPFAGDPPVPVPEPASMALLGMGMLGLCLARRRRQG